MGSGNVAPVERAAYLDAVLAKYHGRLADAGVSVGLEFAHKGKGQSNAPTAICRRGYYCKAEVRITSELERRWGMPDAILSYDNGCWERDGDKRRVATVDHELTHLLVRRNKKGELLRDNHGRPRLRIRPHDWQVGGFDEVIKRHGPDAAPEALLLRSYAGNYDQMSLAFDSGAVEEGDYGEPEPGGDASELTEQDMINAGAEPATA